MSTFVRTINPEMSIREAAKTMNDLDIHRLIVLGHPSPVYRVPIGIICAIDILRAIVK